MRMSIPVEEGVENHFGPEAMDWILRIYERRRLLGVLTSSAEQMSDLVGMVAGEAYDILERIPKIAPPDPESIEPPQPSS